MEQDKIPIEELSEVELGNLSQKELKVVTVKMVKKLGRRMDLQSKKLEFWKERKSKAQPNWDEKYINGNAKYTRMNQ